MFQIEDLIIEYRYRVNFFARIDYTLNTVDGTVICDKLNTSPVVLLKIQF